MFISRRSHSTVRNYSIKLHSEAYNPVSGYITIENLKIQTRTVSKRASTLRKVMFQVLAWGNARVKPSPLKPTFSQFRNCLPHKIANLFILSRLAFKMFMNALLSQLNFYYELKWKQLFWSKLQAYLSRKLRRPKGR